MTNLGDLEVFASVAASGSMSLAAKELGYSPAVISKRIKRLEEKLGARLFQRTTRQISLTESGQGFYERVLAVLEGLEEAEDFVSGRANTVNGTLKVSAPTSFGRMHIAPHLKTFMERHPDLSVNLVLSDEFIDIIEGGYDLAIRIADLNSSSLVARRLAPVRRVLCASAEYVKAYGMPATIEDIRKHRCLPAHNNDIWRL
ncbi:MAG: LysR family transcriptional regulator, partial [Rhizobium pusense]|nr:LysR family transcriptional regulator [Agrobacterium pusense]